MITLQELWCRDAPEGFFWHCQECGKEASLGGNAAYHVTTSGHSMPTLAPIPPPPKPIPPLTKTQLSQVRRYAEWYTQDGMYYGNRKHFEQRHAAIMAWLEAQMEVAK